MAGDLVMEVVVEVEPVPAASSFANQPVNLETSGKQREETGLGGFCMGVMCFWETGPMEADNCGMGAIRYYKEGCKIAILILDPLRQVVETVV